MMYIKKIKNVLWIVIALSCAPFLSAHAQVNWKFTAKKTGNSTYEIHIKAAIEDGWHIYSQESPKGGPVPTKISFAKNPLIILQGKTEEDGEMENYHDEVFGVDVYSYKEWAEFVQVIKVKANVKTNITGTLEYMTCNDHECKPPATEKFSIRLE